MSFRRVHKLYAPWAAPGVRQGLGMVALCLYVVYLTFPVLLNKAGGRRQGRGSSRRSSKEPALGGATFKQFHTVKS